METIAKLKDWDTVSSTERNLNLPPASKFSNFLSASKNVISPPSGNDCHFKQINSPPAIDKDDFPSVSENSDFPSVTENSDFLPVIENDNDQLAFKNKDTQLASQKLNIPLVSKSKNCHKRKKEVPDKKPTFYKPKRRITPHMEKFISSATDLNILKSARTYAKKKESISIVADDTSNCNVDKLTTSSSSEVTNADRFHTVKRNASSPLKYTNGFVDSKNNANNITGELLTDVKHCLFSDILLSECNSNVFECSNNLVSTDSIINEQATSECNNGYLRTRKNLKIHLGGKRNPDCFIEPVPRIQKAKAATTISKVGRKKIVNTHPPFKKTNSKKSNKVNTKARAVCNETGFPIVLQKNNTLSKIQGQNCTDIALVSPIVKKPEVSKLSASNTSTQIQTYSNKRVKGEVIVFNPGGLSIPSCSNERKRKNAFSNCRSTPVQSFSSELKGENTFSNRRSTPVQNLNEKRSCTPRKRVSILDIVKELSFNQSDKLKGIPHLQFKDSTPKSAAFDFENNVIDHPAPKTNSPEKCNFSDKVNKLESISCLPTSLPVKMPHLLSKDRSPTVSDLESDIVKYPAPETISSKKCNLNSDKVKILDNISPCLQSNFPEKMPCVLAKNHSPTSGVSDLESNIVKYPAPKTISLKECMVLSNSMEDHSNNSIDKTLQCSGISDSLILRKGDVSEALKEIGRHLDESLYESKNSTSSTSLSQKKQPVTSLIKAGRKKRTISCDEDLSTAEHPQLSNCVSSGSDFYAMDIEATKKHPLVKQSKILSAQKCSVNDNTERSGQNTEVPVDAPVPSFTKQKSPNKLSSSHVCSKTKLLHIPLVVCDCNNPNASVNNKADLQSLSVQINNFASKVVNMAKKNPQKLQSLITDFGLNTFCKKVEKLFLQCDAKNNCVSPDSHLPKTSSSTSKNELSNSSLGANSSMESETDLQKESIALDYNSESGSDPKQTGASNFSCDLDSEIDIQIQKKTFIQNAFDQINFIHNRCITQLMFDYIRNCDAFELQASVKHFCDDPQTIEVMSKFLSESDEFTVPFSTAKLQYEFPVNFQDLPLFTVIKGYTKCFILKIYPLNCKEITSQSVLDFANENMSVSEISTVSTFFNKVELLKPTDFLSRFTCVAIVAIYNEYHRKKESIYS